MFTKEELTNFETEKIKLINYYEKISEDNLGYYTFEFNSGIQKFYAHYSIFQKEDGIYLHLEEELNPIIVQKNIYRLLFKMKKMLGEKIGEEVHMEEKLIQKIEKLLKYLEL